MAARKKATARIEAAFEQAGIQLWWGAPRASESMEPSRQGRRGGGKLAGGCRHATLDLPPRAPQASLRLLGIIHRVRLIGDNLLTQPEDDRGPNKDRFRPRSS
jgi:hypothetical protein